MLPEFNSLLCLNGTVPKADFLQNYQHLPLIAADGAANKLLSLGYVPKVIIGDLDSVTLCVDFKQSEIIHCCDQDTTDFEKCIIEMQKRRLFPALVIGLSGGDIDHTLYNITLIMKYSKETQMVFYDNQWGIPLYASTQWTLPIGTRVSILPCPTYLITTQGLQWELDEYTKPSVRNKTIRDTVEIGLIHGQALMLCDAGDEYGIAK